MKVKLTQAVRYGGVYATGERYAKFSGIPRAGESVSFPIKDEEGRETDFLGVVEWVNYEVYSEDEPALASLVLATRKVDDYTAFKVLITDMQKAGFRMSVENAGG